jgi:hypothetical protein
VTSEQLPDHGPTNGLGADDERLHLPGSLDADRTYDVLLNERHVWSLQPRRDAVGGDRRLSAPWPKALRRYLRGHAAIALRDHVDGSLVVRTEHVFAGDASREVTVTDREGHALVLDKWGRLIRPLSAEGGAVIDELMDNVVRLLEVLRDKAGVPAFISYGTLLGAVRNGRLIGHDNDIDLAYVSTHPHPVDVVREGYRVERVLLDEGWVVRRGAGTRINVRLQLSDGSMRYIDVFTAHWVEGVLYMPSDTGFRLPRETILPLTTVELLGRQVPAPADSEALLEATYGKNWRVPDPSFKYETPRWLSRRFNGWFGGLKSHRKHWDTFYNAVGRRLPTGPSPFARWVAQEHPSDRPLVDVGAGNGRDALWFARETGRTVKGVDYSMGVTKRNQRTAASQGLPVTFDVVNLYDLREVLALGTRLARQDPPVDLYARFTMHALNYHGRRNVLRLASMALRSGGLLFLEFRTPRDRARPHAFEGHARRYLTPARVVSQIEAAGGRVLSRTEGTGLAPFEDEDAYVCRIVATWSR